MAADMATQPRVDALLNQSPPYLDVDLYASDQPLRNAVASNGGDGGTRRRCRHSASIGAAPACSELGGRPMRTRRS